ncbi:MAG: N-acetylmuramoyl-L-alanine amidase [Chitinophagaceae bacterium]
MKTIFATLICITYAFCCYAQKPDIHFVHPSRTEINTAHSINYISGNTCKNCSLSVNGQAIKVYPTGAFAVQFNLQPGDTTLLFKSKNQEGQSYTKQVVCHYRIPPEPVPDSTFSIESAQTVPSGNCWLRPGDVIRFKVKAQPGNKVTVNDIVPLYEQPVSQTGDMQGIYQGSYAVKANDPLLTNPLVVKMKNLQGSQVSYSLSSQFTVLNPDEPVIGKTIGPLPYLEFGLGSDRLGGAKISYLDTLVLLHITGMIGNEYRVELAPGHSAYIPINDVLLLSKGAFIPHSLSGSWKVWGDSLFDYVSIGLNEKLTYTTFQEIDPSRIVLNIYGATSNTNWITQLLSAKEIKTVWYQQTSDDVMRITIELKHHQAWGYLVYYQGNVLTVRIKRQPQNLSLSHLTIAIDPGHGGTNLGAQGPTGVYEKTVTLQIAKKLQTLLKQSGATVIMTRTSDESKDMIERTMFLREADPDLMVSIHLNSSDDPIHVEGTSTYYRYIGFRPLSTAILKHMTSLGLNDYGNVGRFNFALNGPTEYPNALVETLFISNPADEMKALNPAFQEKIAEAIKAGVVDFLKESKGANN